MSTPVDPSSTPLASYFWIAGVDSLSYGQQFHLNPDTGEKINNGSSSPHVESTIEEDKALETENGSRQSVNGRTSSTTPPLFDKRHSYNRHSGYFDENRFSISSTKTAGTTDSNRSSATIRPVNGNVAPNGTETFDFDKALRKFASERDSFLDDLSFSAGTFVPSKPHKHPKAQKIQNEEMGGRNSSIGSIRRRISFRDLSSAKRQPSMGRSSSVRTSKRLSNYNSVIPAPQPLNAPTNMHPLKRRFEPVLLDRYPAKGTPEEEKRRGPFPDYVPMFAFPNDVNIVSSDEKPRSTWHGFAMTSGDNSRLYGICVIVWMPLNPKAAEEVERQCEEWRKDNMSNEERELANSLGERLAMERAKLSELLAKLPYAVSGSTAREAIEDQISEVEEKIGLMTDLLRPVRHGAAAKIDGLTDGETGLWIPRAYGILGKDETLTGFWKEWLRAVIVPMTQGAILRVPASSPKIGMWQPLERYVVNLCTEAPSPNTSKMQVEIAVRELRLFARNEAVNEIPGSRNTDLYALFRSLSIQNVVTLFEAALTESRIILLSSHTAMLHLASKALASLLYPLTWSGIFIPVLPARLLSALEAPCPYIVGIERRYEKIELPEDDFVLVDLDQDEIQATGDIFPLPRQNRRKLVSILQLAAPHHNRYGVPVGPPQYAIETYPYDTFCSENASVFSQNPPTSTLAKYASLTSTSFGNSAEFSSTPRPPVFNGFLSGRHDQQRPGDRPSTSATNKPSSPPSPISSTSSSQPKLPTTPLSRSDSGFALAATLREKRSGHFDSSSRRSSSFGMDRAPPIRRPSMPFSHHTSSLSTSTSSTDNQSMYQYAPSSYAQSTLAASTIMPNVLMQPVRNTSTTTWAEGHCLQWRAKDDTSVCSICDEKSEEGIYRCTGACLTQHSLASIAYSGSLGCQMNAHGRCSERICLVCPSAFHQDQIQAAFVRCFASLFYTYRKYLYPASGDSKKAGKVFHFNMDAFIKSLPHDAASYVAMLRQTQGFNEFIHERETKKANDPSILIFDQVLLAKRGRGRTSLFSKSTPNFLQDTSDHLWRSAAAQPPSSRFPGDYRQVISRVPAKLDPSLMKEPRVIQGVPRLTTGNARRKPIPSMLGLNVRTG
ncbi:MAG: hypothetical protein M4579_005959 [Chaenotheca gracillima]|nr:MAG: hypothetical protein M4579_005959 [Chaenotheca gracillima]